MLTKSLNINAWLISCTTQLEIFLQQILPTSAASSQQSFDLFAAMRYVVLNGGKRLRPALVYATANALDCTDCNQLNAAAAAIELIHCYSLVHDDLPAMDNDDLRRGKPSCHKAFNEATAILTGDTLQTLAFAVLSNPQLNPLPAAIKINMVNVLAAAAGHQGMVLGQAQDLAAEQTVLSLEALQQLHQHKTGALISAAIELGILAAGCTNPSTISSLQKFGKLIGLAFQVYDDILDITATTAALGKPAGSDLINQKATFPALMGLEQAKTYANSLYAQALAALDEFDSSFDLLRLIAKQTVTRQS